MPAKKPRRIQTRTVLILRCGDRAALRKRPDRGLLAGLWELPNADGVLTPEEALEKVRGWGCKPSDIAPCGEAVHIFTHLEWHMTGYLITCRREGEDLFWADEAALRDTCAVPTAFRAYRRFLP